MVKLQPAISIFHVEVLSPNLKFINEAIMYTTEFGKFSSDSTIHYSYTGNYHLYS